MPTKQDQIDNVIKDAGSEAIDSDLEIFKKDLPRVMPPLTKSRRLDPSDSFQNELDIED